MATGPTPPRWVTWGKRLAFLGILIVVGLILAEALDVWL